MHEYNITTILQHDTNFIKTLVVVDELTNMLQTVQKETQTFKRILFKVKAIDFHNNSTLVAWSANKELYNRVSSKTGLRVLFWG